MEDKWGERIRMKDLIGGGLGAVSTKGARENKRRKKEAVSNPVGELKGCRRDPSAGRASLVSAGKVGLEKHRRRSVDTSVENN